MRHFLRKRFLALFVAAALGVAATALAFTAGGRAASGNICQGTGCLVETLAPHSLAVGATGVSLTKFTNLGSSNATHTAMSVTFSSQVNVSSVQLIAGGVSQGTGTCLPTSGLTSGVTCSDFGSTSSGSSDKLVVQYSIAAAPAAGTVTATGSATVAEGNDNTGGPSNDTFFSSDNAFVFDTATYQSKCDKSGTGNSISGGDASLRASLTYFAGATGPNAANGFLPCTPVGAGVVPNSKGVHTEIAVVDFPALAATTCVTLPPPDGRQFCYATGTLDFTVVPKGENQNNFILYEGLGPVGKVNGQGPYTFVNGSIVVQPCDANGLPPNPGAPASANPVLNDTCVSSRGSLPKGGVELGVHLLASPPDQNFGG